MVTVEVNPFRRTFTNPVPLSHTTTLEAIVLTPKQPWNCAIAVSLPPRNPLLFFRNRIVVVEAKSDYLRPVLRVFAEDARVAYWFTIYISWTWTFGSLGRECEIWYDLGKRVWRESKRR